VRRGVGKTPVVGYTFMVVWGEGEKQHRWRADNQKVGGRRKREKVDEVKDGRVRRLNSQRVLLTSYCHQQGSWDCLVSTAVHGAQVVGGIQKNHTTRVKRPLGLWSRPQRGQGGVSGLKHRSSLAYGPFGGTRSVHMLIACVWVWF
jgi:hypothetical protein